MLIQTINPVVKPWLKALILVLFILLLRYFESHSDLIEMYYANGLFQKMAYIQRLVIGWLPFSVGDILYFIAIIWLLVKIVNLIRTKFSRNGFVKGLGNTVSNLLLVYIFFCLLWGMNYYRLGMSYQLKLQPGAFNTNELKDITSIIINKVNTARKSIRDSSLMRTSPEVIYKEAEQAYNNANKKYVFLHYQNASIKTSLYGKLGNYLGFLGYYNPFTGEAQLNATPPSFILPFTTCHEVAHQLGYASEGEANFVGYLTSKESTNKLFLYSLYFDLFNYANNALFARDSVAARKNVTLLDTSVINDIKIYRAFINSYKNPLEPIITRFYGSYLKANNQPKGLRSYDDVIAWLIAYRKKYGEI